MVSAMKKILTFMILAIASAPALADVNPPMPQPPERLPEALAVIALLAIAGLGVVRMKRNR
jgi:hypothetical protein